MNSTSTCQEEQQLQGARWQLEYGVPFSTHGMMLCWNGDRLLPSAQPGGMEQTLVYTGNWEQACRRLKNQ